MSILATEMANELGPKQDELKQTPLDNNQIVTLDLSEPIRDDEYGFSKKLFPYGSLVGIVEAADKRFGIIDLRATPNITKPPADFLLIDESFDAKGFKNGSSEGLKAIRQSTRLVTIGRNHFSDRFDYSPYVSANHFTINYHDGVLRIQNLQPTNGTNIYSKNPPSIEADAMGGRTVLAQERAEGTTAYSPPTESEPYGSFMNHPIIGKNSPTVENGVYMGGSSREAIVVDNRSEVLQDSYTKLIEKIQSENPADPVAFLEIVKSLVQTEMPYDGNKTGLIASKYRGDQLVGLSEFIKEKAGVCRHQALFASFLINRLIEDGYLEGVSHVQRNSVPDYGGAHGWATFVHESGVEFVVDPAQNFVGTKEEARRQPNRWQYYVPFEEQPMRLS